MWEAQQYKATMTEQMAQNEKLKKENVGILETQFSEEQMSKWMSEFQKKGYDIINDIKTQEEKAWDQVGYFGSGKNEGRKEYYETIKDSIQTGLKLDQKDKDGSPTINDLLKVLREFFASINSVRRGHGVIKMSKMKEWLGRAIIVSLGGDNYINQELSVAWPSRVAVDHTTQLGQPSKKQRVLGY